MSFQAHLAFLSHGTRKEIFRMLGSEVNSVESRLIHKTGLKCIISQVCFTSFFTYSIELYTTLFQSW